MRALILTTVVVLAASVQAQARPAWTSGTYVYADLCTEPHTGAVAGHRITLRRWPNGDGIVYEAAPGGIGAPIRAGDVSFVDSARAVSFSLQTVTGRIAFEGTATQDALTGTLRDPDGEHPVNLPRVLRSHARGACTAAVTGSLSASR